MHREADPIVAAEMVKPKCGERWGSVVDVALDPTAGYLLVWMLLRQ